MMLVKSFSTVAALVAALGGIGCASVNDSQSMRASTIEALFTVKAASDRSVVRVVTRNTLCPDIVWADGQRERMRVRAEAVLVPLRGDSVQSDSKPAHFDVLTCQVEWRQNATGATVENRVVPAPHKQINRIVLIGDTGCRMKASDNAFQQCLDATRWPFAQVAASAALMKPDLVIHLGDIHYRESPCPIANAGCANSPWGYGMDAWRADLFEPAAPLLAAAPWLFVRGNHESCFRAGQGWFRFIDGDAWTSARSCDSPVNDINADFTAPYAVPLGADEQLIVFDSSKSSGKPYAPSDAAFRNYVSQMKEVAALAKRRPHNFFLSHHPLLAFAPEDGAGRARPGGSRGLQSAFAVAYPERLFPDAVNVVMHGHIHLFEAIGFSSDHPASFILGNAGSATEGRAPTTLDAGAQPYVNAHVEDYASNSDFGFAVLDRVENSNAAQWRITEYDTLGRMKIVCEIQGAKSRCHQPK